MRYRATFHPQAWVRDNATPVDPEGETSWDCTAYVAEIEAAAPGWLARTMGRRDARGRGRDYDDCLRDDPAAPEWVREWHGPFDTELVETDNESCGSCGADIGPSTDALHARRAARGANDPLNRLRAIGDAANERGETITEVAGSKRSDGITPDSFGRTWPEGFELCATCGQPDNCGDCTHAKLEAADVRALGGTV